MKFKYIITICSFLLIIGFAFFSDIFIDQTDKKKEFSTNALESLKFDRYYGRVEKKDFFRSPKSVPFFYVRNEFGSQKVYLQFDKSGLYDYLEINDSVSKKYGSLEVFVIRDSINKKFELQLDDLTFSYD